MISDEVLLAALRRLNVAFVREAAALRDENDQPRPANNGGENNNNRPPRRVVSEHLRRRLWLGLCDEDKDCPVCLDAIRDFASFAVLPCGHSFHRACLLHTPSCPVCRAEP